MQSQANPQEISPQKIYSLAKERDKAALTAMVAQGASPNVWTTAVGLLADEYDFESIHFLKNEKFELPKEIVLAVQEILHHYFDLEIQNLLNAAVEKFAKQGLVHWVNRLIKEGARIVFALKGYRQGKYLNGDQERVLELMSLTDNVALRRAIAKKIEHPLVDIEELIKQATQKNEQQHFVLDSRTSIDFKKRMIRIREIIQSYEDFLLEKEKPEKIKVKPKIDLPLKMQVEQLKALLEAAVEERPLPAEPEQPQDPSVAKICRLARVRCKAALTDLIQQGKIFSHFEEAIVFLAQQKEVETVNFLLGKFHLKIHDHPAYLMQNVYTLKYKMDLAVYGYALGGHQTEVDALIARGARKDKAYEGYKRGGHDAQASRLISGRKEIFRLAKLRSKTALTQFVKIDDFDTRNALILLARTKDTGTVNYLLSEFHLDINDAVRGYVSAGYVDEVDECIKNGASIHSAVLGYAEGRCTKQVNKLVAEGAMIALAYAGYASYLSGDREELLQLMCLTDDINLRYLLARKTKEKNDSLDVEALMLEAENLRWSAERRAARLKAAETQLVKIEKTQAEIESKMEACQKLQEESQAALKALLPVSEIEKEAPNTEKQEVDAEKTPDEMKNISSGLQPSLATEETSLQLTSPQLVEQPADVKQPESDKQKPPRRDLLKKVMPSGAFQKWLLGPDELSGGALQLLKAAFAGRTVGVVDKLLDRNSSIKAYKVAIFGYVFGGHIEKAKDLVRENIFYDPQRWVQTKYWVLDFELALAMRGDCQELLKERMQVDDMYNDRNGTVASGYVATYQDEKVEALDLLHGAHSVVVLYADHGRLKGNFNQIARLLALFKSEDLRKLMTSEAAEVNDLFDETLYVLLQQAARFAEAFQLYRDIQPHLEAESKKYGFDPMRFLTPELRLFQCAAALGDEKNIIMLLKHGAFTAKGLGLASAYEVAASPRIQALMLCLSEDISDEEIEFLKKDKEIIFDALCELPDEIANKGLLAIFDPKSPIRKLMYASRGVLPSNDDSHMPQEFRKEIERRGLKPQEKALEQTQSTSPQLIEPLVEERVIPLYQCPREASIERKALMLCLSRTILPEDVEYLKEYKEALFKAICDKKFPKNIADNALYAAIHNPDSPIHQVMYASRTWYAKCDDDSHMPIEIRRELVRQGLEVEPAFTVDLNYQLIFFRTETGEVDIEDPKSTIDATNTDRPSGYKCLRLL